MQVVFSKRARREFDTAAAWWREHRGLAPYLFEDEIIQAVKLLATNPLAGPEWRDVRTNGVRRDMLQQTQDSLHDRVREDTGLVEILRLWHTSRRPPKSPRRPRTTWRAAARRSDQSTMRHRLD